MALLFVKNPNFGNVTAKTNVYSTNYFYFRFIKVKNSPEIYFLKGKMGNFNISTTFVPTQ